MVRVPGYDVDRVDIDAGLRKLRALGFHDRKTTMVIQYALQRNARGEEAAAEKGAIDRSFHGIDLTSWRMVLAAARAAGEASAKEKSPR
ncbi:hypothetical protein [Dietzia sp. 179-F 9C3 NHS]|uniref:hypothetical protein n=1 Tax=Dietzia sp. 179-F 9C3 NHS TaxID=3374295 RepID=UPI003878F87A